MGVRKAEQQNRAAVAALPGGQQQKKHKPEQRRKVQPLKHGQQVQRVRNTPPAQPVEKKKKAKRFYDFNLLAAVLFITAFGLLMIYSSSQYTAALRYKGDSTYYFRRQLAIAGAGLVVAITASKFDYHLLEKKWIKYPVFWGSIALLIGVIIMGVASHGQARWIRIAGVQFQPTEMAKVGLIIMLASMIAQRGYYINKWKFAWPCIAVAFLPFILVGQANLSSGLIIAGITAVMLFVSCRMWWFFVAGASCAAAALLFTKPLIEKWVLANNITTSTSYQLRRVLAWAMPERFSTDAYQTLQGIYAIGSGGITGQGLGESIQKFGKLPEAQNDMIFSIICEELGLIGALLVIFLFIIIIWRLALIAINAPDLFGSMLCVGVLAHISLQVILNIAVVTNVIPNTGVTLPFVSYGGSAVIFTLGEIGIALSVSNQIRLE
ncbi:MAG: putative peptidoglycan glycosyltransferase FtsW [Eubacteriales bacterium]|nr:putative peptidoglycan glycosyltransferase FtsW [Eubacteriales bacterium]